MGHPKFHKDPSLFDSVIAFILPVQKGNVQGRESRRENYIYIGVYLHCSKTKYIAIIQVVAD